MTYNILIDLVLYLVSATVYPFYATLGNFRKNFLCAILVRGKIAKQEGVQAYSRLRWVNFFMCVAVKTNQLIH